MGEARAPLSPQSQQLTKTISAVASAAGVASFKFDAPPQGFTWSGTITVQGAPATAVFLANIGATPWGDWAGNSIGGPIQAFGNQQVVITATGLTSGQGYLCVWTGSSDPSDMVAPIWPEPSSSAQQVLLGLGTTIYPSTLLAPVAGVITLPVLNPPNSVRTLLVSLMGTAAVTTLNITGNQSGISYYFRAPYINELGTDTYFVVVPIAGAIDDTFTVTVTTATSCTVEVIGDTALYQESIFYNGFAAGAGAARLAAGTSTVLNGPARLLTAQVETLGAFSANLLINGNQILRVDGLAGQNGFDAVAFPPNTILSAGQAMTVTTSGLGGASCTYAYP